MLNRRRVAWNAFRRHSRCTRRTLFLLVSLVIAIPLVYQYIWWLNPCDSSWVNSRIHLAWINGRQDVERAVSSPTPQCVDDCEKLRVMFQTNWPPEKPKAFIYYLVQGELVHTHLKRSLHRLHENFNAKYDYPIVVFYNETDPLVNTDEIRSLTKSRLFFQPVTFQLPPFLDERLVPEHGCLSRFPVGYRHMCRFQAVGVYEQPVMSRSVGAQFAWRLDDDSFITQPIHFDLFVFMRDNGLQYGYLAENQDNKECTCGLWKAADTYIQFEALTPTFYHDRPALKVFYNNFEISDLAIWRSMEYRKYVAYIDRVGGIYLRRWGDAPIKTIAVSLFVDFNRTHKFQSINYEHRTLVLPEVVIGRRRSGSIW